MKIAIVTLCIGPDYSRAMEPGFKSKRDYAAKWGYDFVLGGEEFWDRDRPIPWSKIPFFLSVLDKYDWIWFSDADSVITNPEIRLETLIERIFGPNGAGAGKDAAWWLDGCANINSGQILARGRSPIVKRWLKETGEQTDLLYHGWWENAGMIRVWMEDPEIQAGIELRQDYKCINAYLFPKKGYEAWAPGDFVLHLAGVYEPNNIYRFMNYALECVDKKVNPDMAQMMEWIRNPPASLKDAGL